MSFPDDGTMHGHHNLFGMSKPEFVNVRAGQGAGPGYVSLHWSSQSCFNAMKDTMEGLRTLLINWGFDPDSHSVTGIATIGELEPAIVHTLPFTTEDPRAFPEVQTAALSTAQIDTIADKLHVFRRYTGKVTAKRGTLDDGTIAYTLVCERIGDSNSDVFVDCADFTEASQRRGEPGNFRLTVDPQKEHDRPATTTKEVWDLGYLLLGHMNAQPTEVNFV